MQVTYELQLDDWRAPDRFFKARQKLTRSQKFSLFLMRGIVCLFLVPGVVAPLYYFDSPIFKSEWKSSGVWSLWPVTIALIPLVGFAVAWFGAPLLQGNAFRESPFYKRQLTLSVERDGVRGEKLTPWSQIHAIEETPSHIFITFGDNHVIVIPTRAFESQSAATQFAARCRDGWERAQMPTA